MTTEPPIITVGAFITRWTPARPAEPPVPPPPPAMTVVGDGLFVDASVPFAENVEPPAPLVATPPAPPDAAPPEPPFDENQKATPASVTDPTADTAVPPLG